MRERPEQRIDKTRVLVRDREQPQRDSQRSKIKNPRNKYKAFVELLWEQAQPS